MIHLPYGQTQAQPQIMPFTVPVGTVIAYAGPIDAESQLLLTRQGWLLCDGRKVQVCQFPALAALLRDAYGNQQDGNFYLPDYRGVFLRGVNGTRDPAYDPGAGSRTGSGPNGEGNTGNSVGSLQEDQFEEHEHGYTAPLTPTNAYEAAAAPAVPGVNSQATTASVVCQDRASWKKTPCFGAETRPLNMYVHFLIKAADAVCIAVPSAPGGLMSPGGLLR